MEKTAAILAIAVVILYGLYNAAYKHPKYRQTQKITHANPIHHPAITHKQYTPYDYIVNVIKHGSHSLGFPGGVMDGSYIDDADAPKVACYVLKLSGKRCPAGTEAADAQLIFSSVCAGCHGNDGRGIHGTYPDLTRPTLLGIKRMQEAQH